ncbi:MAG TPA: ribose-5-phosphate isomerase RpiA [Thermopetrobacter sp.]|nr:ribose-5-phosphate isomerase RpiA [Thermopetrobacter sp.]
MDAQAQKKAAAVAALEFIGEGMKVGLGTGSTADLFIDALGEKVKQGLNVLCVPTSIASEKRARALGIALSTLDETPQLDVTVDGADEILDPSLVLIKGGGGALTREKIVAASSEKVVVIADQSKLKTEATFGAFPLPVEILPFGAAATILKMRRAIGKLGMGGDLVVRQHGGAPFVTDNGGLIVDCHLGHISEPEKLAGKLGRIPGVVEQGLFVGIASVALVAGAGDVMVLERPAD